AKCSLPVAGSWLSESVEQLELNRDSLGLVSWVKQLILCARVNHAEFPQHLIGKRVSLDLIISPRNLTGLAEPMKSFVCEDPDNAFVQVLHRGFGVNPFPFSPARSIAVNRASILLGFSRPSSIRVAVDRFLPGDDRAWKRSRHLATEAD